MLLEGIVGMRLASATLRPSTPRRGRARRRRRGVVLGAHRHRAARVVARVAGCANPRVDLRPLAARARSARSAHQLGASPGAARARAPAASPPRPAPDRRVVEQRDSIRGRARGSADSQCSAPRPRGLPTEHIRLTQRHVEARQRQRRARLELHVVRVRRRPATRSAARSGSAGAPALDTPQRGRRKIAVPG